MLIIFIYLGIYLVLCGIGLLVAGLILKRVPDSILFAPVVPVGFWLLLTTVHAEGKSLANGFIENVLMGVIIGALVVIDACLVRYYKLNPRKIHIIEYVIIVLTPFLVHLLIPELPE